MSNYTFSLVITQVARLKYVILGNNVQMYAYSQKSLEDEVIIIAPVVFTWDTARKVLNEISAVTYSQLAEAVIAYVMN